MWFNIAVIALSLIGAAFCWVWVCIQKTNYDKDKLCNLLYEVYVPYDWSLEEFNAAEKEDRMVSREAHCWRRITFRDPWKIYGPISISLIRGYPFDGEFWQWYKYVYNNEYPYYKNCINHFMANWNQTVSTNPMNVICQSYLGHLSGCLPNHPSAMIDGASEYDEIMKMQEQLGI